MNVNEKSLDISWKEENSLIVYKKIAFIEFICCIIDARDDLVSFCVDQVLYHASVHHFTSKLMLIEVTF